MRFIFLRWVIIQYYFIYLSIYQPTYLYFRYLSFIYHLSQMIPTLAIGSSLVGSSAPTPLTNSLCVCLLPFVLVFLNTSLLSATMRYSRFILYIFCSWPRTSHFSKEPWFLLLENSIGNQDLGARCAHCYWGFIVSRTSQLTEQMNIYVNTVCIHISVRILHVITCVYIKLNSGSYCLQL